MEHGSALDGERVLQESFVGKRVRVVLKPQERRAFVGTFVCVDHLGNIVLHEVVEQRLPAQDIEDIDTIVSERPVPMTMIPGNWVGRVLVYPTPAMQVDDMAIS